MLKYCDLSATYAWKSNDTLAALICHAKKASAYDQLMINDSTIACYTHAIELLRKYNYNKVAAGFSGVTANKLIEKGDLDSAIVFLHDYEMNSGYFNSVGDIVDGREIYYYWRGTYHLRKRQLDSAEYYLRKELKEGNDFNNQNAGSLGLAHLFQQRNMPDSAAKYYAYSYAMNDSVFAHKTAK